MYYSNRPWDSVDLNNRRNNISSKKIRLGLLPACLFLIFTLFNCGRQVERSDNILFKVDDKVVTVDEFLRRAEYTIRPAYCNSDNYIHKKIILNTLVAEKLLAMEAGDSNELEKNENFQAYIKGRREQAMRQWLFYQEAFKPVSLDTNEVKTYYKSAGRRYNIAYFNLNNSLMAAQVGERLNGGDSFEQIYRELSGTDSLNLKQVRFDGKENPVVREKLFGSPQQKGDVIGPFQVNGSYLTVKILGWTESPAISDSDISERWKMVQDVLRDQYAQQNYGSLVQQIMKGKNIEFNPGTFIPLVKAVAPLYLSDEGEIKQSLRNNLWNEENGDAEEADYQAIEELLEKPLFTIDGQTWTVQMLYDEMVSHPLVFRKTKMKKSEFGEQFKLAIVDLVRDRYVTNYAYDQGYDRERTVQQYEDMWKDNLLALYARNRYLKQVDKFSEFATNYLDVVEDELNPYVSGLFKKYSDRIEINIEAFENIELSRIDMHVLQPKAAFPTVVPGFPVITTEHRLDYGSVLATNRDS